MARRYDARRGPLIQQTQKEDALSNAIINIRFGAYHVQALRDRPFLRISRNAYHDEARKRPGWRWFEIY